MQIIRILICCLPLWLYSSCRAIVAPPSPYGVLPSERQLRWHEMEMYCLIHYTPTTFQNKEWGFGDADPSLFNPSNFDANQIAEAAASAGFKGLISVAKHHDGFCLWPTSTTAYNISNSPWRDGNGDMVAEFSRAARDAGLEFGVYLSAWDRNDPRYGSEAYTEAYRAQLTELMTGYGPLFTSWHDGANGGDGYYGGKNETRKIDRTTYYEWEEKTWPIVREHQPMAMIFSDIGPDMRWVGNERGFAAETSWATITPTGIDGGKPMPGSVDESNLPTGDRDGKFWIPAECDVPHRKGWFYHAEEGHLVKSPDELFEIYLKSVGRGANMNLGLAPMPEGHLHDNDVRSLRFFGEKLQRTFGTNYASGASVVASNVRGDDAAYAASNVLDSDRYSYYASDDDVLNPVLEVTLASAAEYDLLRFRENIKLGQRLDSVVVEYQDGDIWKRLASATSIGANRLIKLDEPVSHQRLRISLFAPVAPALSDIGLFKEAAVAYSLLAEPDRFKRLPNDAFTLVSSHDLSAALDGDPNTFATIEKYAEGIVFDVSGRSIVGFEYLPRQDRVSEGTARRYKVESSSDGENWNVVQVGEFSNIINNPVLLTIHFDKALETKYIRFVPEAVVGDFFTAAEFWFLQDMK